MDEQQVIEHDRTQGPWACSGEVLGFARHEVVKKNPHVTKLL